MKNILSFLVLFIISAIAGFYFFGKVQMPKTVLVAVSFSHYVHTKQHKMECKNCHQNINTQQRAGIPNIETCSLCHANIINPQSEEEKKIYNYVKDNKLIPWQNYYVVPDYAIFSHRRHTKIGNLECGLCHGDMTTQTSPILNNFRPFEMKICVDCHKQKNITTECNNCHH